MSEQSKPRESIFTRVTRRVAPFLLAVPLVAGPHREASTRPVENDPNRAGQPAETIPDPVSLPRNLDNMVEIYMPPLLPTNWQEDPRYANDRITVIWKGGTAQEISPALFEHLHIVLDQVGEDENGNPVYEWHYNDPEHPPVPPQQGLSNAVRGVLGSEVPTTPPIVETVTPADLPRSEGYIPVNDMELKTSNGEQVVRFFMQHPDAAPGAGSYIIEVNPDSVVFSDGTTAAYEDYKHRHPSIQFTGEIPSLEDARESVRPIVSVERVVIFNGELASESATAETPASAETDR